MHDAVPSMLFMSDYILKFGLVTNIYSTVLYFCIMSVFGFACGKILGTEQNSFLFICDEHIVLRN